MDDVLVHIAAFCNYNALKQMQSTCPEWRHAVEIYISGDDYGMFFVRSIVDHIRCVTSDMATLRVRSIDAYFDVIPITEVYTEMTLSMMAGVDQFDINKLTTDDITMMVYSAATHCGNWKLAPYALDYCSRFRSEDSILMILYSPDSYSRILQMVVDSGWTRGVKILTAYKLNTIQSSEDADVIAVRHDPSLLVDLTFNRCSLLLSILIMTELMPHVKPARRITRAIRWMHSRSCKENGYNSDHQCLVCFPSQQINNMTALKFIQRSNFGMRYND
jgi:hypothetical protein